MLPYSCEPASFPGVGGVLLTQNRECALVIDDDDIRRPYEAVGLLAVAIIVARKKIECDHSSGVVNGAMRQRGMADWKMKLT